MKSLKLIPLVGLLLMGCTQQPQGRVMMDTNVTIGSIVPEIYFQGLDGSQRTLSQVRQPISLIAFVGPSGDACNLADQRLVSVSRQFWNVPVSVVQVSEPTSKCPYGPGCVQTAGPGKHDVIAICDPNRAAWQSFGSPAIDSLLLLDANGRVVQVSHVSTPDALVREARRMAYEYMELHEPKFQD